LEQLTNLPFGTSTILNFCIYFVKTIDEISKMNIGN
jgi:hypothetical protein